MHSTTEKTMNAIDIHYWLHESPDAKREAAIDADEHRDELIAEKKEELIEQRLADLSNDDIICALQSGFAEVYLPQIRAALKEDSTLRSHAILLNLVDHWIRSDSEIEAIKWMERMESDDHPARH
jgi:hypothetical protein